MKIVSIIMLWLNKTKLTTYSKNITFAKTKMNFWKFTSYSHPAIDLSRFYGKVFNCRELKKWRDKNCFVFKRVSIQYGFQRNNRSRWNIFIPFHFYFLYLCFMFLIPIDLVKYLLMNLRAHLLKSLMIKLLSLKIVYNRILLLHLINVRKQQQTSNNTFLKSVFK